MSGIRLKVEKLESKRWEHKWNKGELAKAIGVARPTLYRASLDPKNPLYNSPGERVIAGVLNAFPGSVFEDFFFFE
jgi:hypothetical protein